MRALILVLLWMSGLEASGGTTATNQSGVTVFVSSVRGRQPIVGVQRGDFPSDHKFLKVNSQVSRRWQTNYAVFGKALLESAKKEQLDSSSLAKVLHNLRSAPENKNLAILPVAATSTKKDGALVWIVVLRWEIAKWAAEGETLGHIREFTVTQKTLKQIGFETCG